MNVKLQFISIKFSGTSWVFIDVSPTEALWYVVGMSSIIINWWRYLSLFLIYNRATGGYDCLSGIILLAYLSKNHRMMYDNNIWPIIVVIGRVSVLLIEFNLELAIEKCLPNNLNRPYVEHLDLWLMQLSFNLATKRTFRHYVIIIIE